MTPTVMRSDAGGRAARANGLAARMAAAPDLLRKPRREMAKEGRERCIGRSEKQRKSSTAHPASYNEATYYLEQAAMPTFEESLKKLETIVEQLEKGDLPLEESLKLFEQGVELSAVCKKELDEAEGKVQMLVKQRDGSLKTAPFPSE
jgi:exodeoxyribonuclease VII small subunit